MRVIFNRFYIIVKIGRSEQTRLKKVVPTTDIENSSTTSPTKQHHKMMMIKNVCSSPPRRGDFIQRPRGLIICEACRPLDLYWTLPLCLCALSAWCLVLGATCYCTLCLFDWWAWCRPLYLVNNVPVFFSLWSIGLCALADTFALRTLRCVLGAGPPLRHFLQQASAIKWQVTFILSLGSLCLLLKG